MPLDWSHAEFRFRSPHDWQQLGADARHIQLYCRETGTSLTLSIVPQEVAPAEQESAGRLLMAERRQSHLDAVTRTRPNGVDPELRYDFERLEPHRSGNGFEVVYEGVHAGYSFFGFLGYVTTRKVFGLFVETGMSFIPGRHGMFREVVAGFDIKLP